MVDNRIPSLPTVLEKNLVSISEQAALSIVARRHYTFRWGFINSQWKEFRHDYKYQKLRYSELEAYPRILRQISVLRYEMEHPAHVSAQEMLDAMTYACGDRTGSSPGHVSDKTFYIAMNYRQKAAAANSEISEEISAKLLELERKKGRIEYYVGMLDSRKANVIRLCFFEGRTIEDAAEELNISAKTAQIAKKKAIEDLTDLFALTSNIN